MNGQLELTLTKGCLPQPPKFANRPKRTSWWFDRMRQVVDSAISWEAAMQARPEQLVLANVHRAAASA